MAIATLELESDVGVTRFHGHYACGPAAAAGAIEAPAKLARIAEAHEKEARVGKTCDYYDDNDDSESIIIEDGGI